MKLAIRYSAVYQYEEPASFSPHIARIFPRQDLSARVDRTDFHTNEGADVQFRQDLFGSTVARCFYPEMEDHLDHKLELDLTIEPRNAFHFLLDTHALEMPFTYQPQEAAALGPYLNIQNLPGPLPEVLQRPDQPRPTVEALIAMNEWLFKNIAYEVRPEGEPFPPEKTLRELHGSCRDYAAVLVDVLRLQGVATRLASGFLWADASDDRPSRAENAMHAWIEAFLPGAGWVGLDPTNGVFCDHHYLPTAVGLTPADISPISGSYFGKKSIRHTLTTDLSVKEITP